MKCFWVFFHSWNAWTILKRANILDRKTDDLLGEMVVQTRACSKCGLSQFKTSSYMV